MYRKTIYGSLAIVCLLAASVPAWAHHAFAAEFDVNQPVKVSGTITKVEWVNPHAWIYVDVKDATGKVTNWNFELGAIPVLLKQGWRPKHRIVIASWDAEEEGLIGSAERGEQYESELTKAVAYFNMDVAVSGSKFGASSVLGPLLRRVPGAANVRHAGDAGGVAKLLATLQESPA